eukprot:gene12688-15920_t
MLTLAVPDLGGAGGLAPSSRSDASLPPWGRPKLQAPAGSRSLGHFKLQGPAGLQSWSHSKLQAPAGLQSWGHSKLQAPVGFQTLGHSKVQRSGSRPTLPLPLCSGKRGDVERPPKLPKNLSWMHIQVLQSIRAKKLLEHNCKVLVAVSGGQDPLCLAEILNDIKRAYNSKLDPLCLAEIMNGIKCAFNWKLLAFNWELVIAHLDHNWRDDSAANADHVRALAASRWKLDYVQCTADAGSIDSEAAARKWRYHHLAVLAKAHGCSAVVTGHTASDRAETLLLNLMRGAGTNGLQALQWRRPLRHTVSGTEKVSQTESETGKVSERVSETEKVSKTALAAEKVSEAVSETDKVSETVCEAEQGSETVSEAEKVLETVSEGEQVSETVSEAAGVQSEKQIVVDTKVEVEKKMKETLLSDSQMEEVSIGDTLMRGDKKMVIDKEIREALLRDNQMKPASLGDTQMPEDPHLKETPIGNVGQREEGREEKHQMKETSQGDVHTHTVTLARPLMGLSREDTADFCRSADLPVWEDSTNADSKYRRNRVRNELLPYLRTHFNPKADQALSRAAEVLAADIDLLDSMASTLLQTLLHSGGQALDRVELRAAPLALQRRAVHHFLERLVGSGTSTYEHVDSIIMLLDAPNKTRTNCFARGAYGYVDGRYVFVVAGGKKGGRAMDSGKEAEA